MLVGFEVCGELMHFIEKRAIETICMNISLFMRNEVFHFLFLLSFYSATPEVHVLLFYKYMKV